MYLVYLFACLTVTHGLTWTYTNSWTGGCQGEFHVIPDHEVYGGWQATMSFDSDVDALEIWIAKEISRSGNTFVVENMPFNNNFHTNQDVLVTFIVRISGTECPTGTVVFTDGGSTSGVVTKPVTNSPAATDAPVGSSPGTSAPNDTATQAPMNAGTTSGTAHVQASPMRHDYGDAMKMSILFYDAQRSGKLPGNNPIPWRGDSAMGDNGDGHDLTGGWYDAGDHVKFGLPMAFSSWVLNYGFLKFSDAYEAKGQTQMMCDMVKWPLEYFLKCWQPDQHVFWAQVGDGNVDHNYWGRPEDMPRDMYRPALPIRAGEPGADIVADSVSALASGYLVFKDICGDEAFANKLLAASKTLYDFIQQTNGVFVKSKPFYGDSSDQDEKFTAGAWMYMATHQDRYLNDAKAGHVTGVPWNFMWGEKTMGGTLLLYEITKDNQYRQQIVDYVKSFMPGGSVPYTPCGLAFRDAWGSNRHAANAAFVATVAAEYGINADEYKKWAMTQLNYILGDNNLHMRSGLDPAIQNVPIIEQVHVRHGDVQMETRFPHELIGAIVDRHIEALIVFYFSSCETWGCPDGDNPHELKGAIVGGPDQNDHYNDDRNDYQLNEVACDYNAGFQGALAGLYHFAIKGDLPASPAPKC